MKEFLAGNKIGRVLLIIVLVVLVIFLITFLFLKFWIPFGGSPSKEDKLNYAKRADNYKDGIFYNEHDYQIMYDSDDKNEFVSNKGTTPIDKIPVVTPDFIDEPSIELLNVTWFGHSTILLQMHGMNILIDPVFSEVASPVSFIGPKRFSDLPIDIDELPEIDIVIISHDHYDHLDYKTIKELDEKVKNYVVPLGVENHLERWGVATDKIINMAWWEETEINGLTIGCTPARHNSARSLNDRFSTLWASWVFVDEYHKVFESGDTGYDTHFQEVYEKYGEFDLAMLDSGQYNVKWTATHMNPEEAVMAGKDLNAKVMMPIHWGAFQLSEHPWDDGVLRFTNKADIENMKYITPMIGETITYSEEMRTAKWWENVN